MQCTFCIGNVFRYICTCICIRFVFQTYLWVLNSEEEFERAFKLGSTGVMTDFPTLLREYIDKNHPEFQERQGYQSVDTL